MLGSLGPEGAPWQGGAPLWFTGRLSFGRERWHHHPTLSPAAVEPRHSLIRAKAVISLTSVFLYTHTHTHTFFLERGGGVDVVV